MGNAQRDTSSGTGGGFFDFYVYKSRRLTFIIGSSARYGYGCCCDDGTGSGLLNVVARLCVFTIWGKSKGARFVFCNTNTTDLG
jgi:hypothetical protein